MIARNMFDLSGKVALVTGGSRALGRQWCMAMAEFGADVAVEKNLTEAKAETEARLADMENTRKALVDQLNQVYTKLQQNQSQMQEMSAKLQAGEQSGVRQAQKGP